MLKINFWESHPGTGREVVELPNEDAISMKTRNAAVREAVKNFYRTHPLRDWIHGRSEGWMEMGWNDPELVAEKVGKFHHPGHDSSYDSNVEIGVINKGVSIIDGKAGPSVTFTVEAGDDYGFDFELTVADLEMLLARAKATVKE